MKKIKRGRGRKRACEIDRGIDRKWKSEIEGADRWTERKRIERDKHVERRDKKRDRQKETEREGVREMEE